MSILILIFIVFKTKENTDLRLQLIIVILCYFGAKLDFILSCVLWSLLKFNRLTGLTIKSQITTEVILWCGLNNVT